MEYEQIKRDVNEFKMIAYLAGLRGYCIMGSLLLVCCLKDHGIECELVKGYLVIGDTYWNLHVWSKIVIEGESHQIDVTGRAPELKDMTIEYTLSLRDKWKSLIDTDEEQKDYDEVTKTFAIYQTHGTRKALVYLANRLNHAERWKIIVRQLCTLPTFRTIKRHTKIFSL
jgi:hypothetical protein